MKHNKFIIAVLIVALISGAIALASFIITDVPQLQEQGFSWRTIARDINGSIAFGMTDEEILGSFEEVDMNNLSGGFEIRESDSNKNYLDVQYHGNNPFNNQISYLVENNHLTLSGNLDNNAVLTLYLADPQSVNVTIDTIEGALIIETVLNSLSIEEIEGAFDLVAEKTFDMDIDTVDGAMNMSFENFTADLSIGSLNGPTSIMGSDSLGTNVSYNESIGNSTEMHTINIEEINGAANIEEN